MAPTIRMVVATIGALLFGRVAAENSADALQAEAWKASGELIEEGEEEIRRMLLGVEEPPLRAPIDDKAYMTDEERFVRSPDLPDSKKPGGAVLASAVTALALAGVAAFLRSPTSAPASQQAAASAATMAPGAKN
eukprot:TRINITY_DN93980_c0_g1_i1.p1 TRINITY_DN93980_c0_g1~~TRINITY_DN93980_c0_g1_i1.p1  ORF type:complete len:135 (+),score=45.26 TRINITY_DN93980_c0_g1_i1:106-510(+)